MEVKIILKASMIPVNSIIYKINGVVQHTITDSIKVYKQDGDTQIIKAEGGTRFLIPIKPTCSMSAVSEDTEFVWITDLRTACEFFNNVVFNEANGTSSN